MFNSTCKCREKTLKDILLLKGISTRVHNFYRSRQWCFTHGVQLLRLFNNMRTLKFKIQPTVMLFTAINHCSGPLKGDLDGTILPTICRMRHAYAMPTTRIVSCKSTYNILTTDAHNTKNVVGF